MQVRMIAFGGDERMQGAVQAAQRAGWEAQHVRMPWELGEIAERADAVLLPWPKSFFEEKLVGTQLSMEEVLAHIPPCSVLVHGSGVSGEALSQAAELLNPAQDEAFVQANAEITAEGAIARAMQRPGCALLGSTVVITGFGRIGQALCSRLVALGAFVIVCARNEGQMRKAHELGAHPMALSRIASACAQGDVIFNTVPAWVLGEAALARVGEDALIVELASAPYGMDLKLAAQMGVNVAVESGVPGRYAPLPAGAALFDAVQRAVSHHQQDRQGGV